MTDVMIIDGARTPMGGLLGDLADVTANELGTTAITATLERSGAKAEAIDEVFMGCVLPAGLKQCPARQAMLGAGIPNTTGAVTINKACGSGMQATIFAADSITAGTNQLVISGGLESMSNAPQILMTGRRGQRLGHTKLYDHMFLDGRRRLHRRSHGHFRTENRGRARTDSGRNGRVRHRKPDPCAACY